MFSDRPDECPFRPVLCRFSAQKDSHRWSRSGYRLRSSRKNDDVRYLPGGRRLRLDVGSTSKIREYLDQLIIHLR